MSDEEELRRYQAYHSQPGVGETGNEGLTLVDYNEEYKELGLAE